MSRIPPDDIRRSSRRRPPGHTKKDKLVTVIAAEVDGIRAAAKLANVTRETVRRWRTDEELLPYVMGARRQIMGDVTESAQRAWALTLARLRDTPDDIPTRELLAIASESTNKMQLLGGGATQRTEHKDVTEYFDDEQTQFIVNAARAYLARHGPSARAGLVAGPTVEVPPKTVTDPA